MKTQKIGTAFNVANSQSTAKAKSVKMVPKHRVSPLILAAFSLMMTLAAGASAQAMPGDMLDQAFHQSMREHSTATQDLAATGTTRANTTDTVPSVQSDGLRIVGGQGEILPDAASEGLLPKATHASNSATFGLNDPSRMDASASSFTSQKGISEDVPESADQELADPAP